MLDGFQPSSSIILPRDLADSFIMLKVLKPIHSSIIVICCLIHSIILLFNSFIFHYDAKNTNAVRQMHPLITLSAVQLIHPLKTVNRVQIIHPIIVLNAVLLIHL